MEGWQTRNDSIITSRLSPGPYDARLAKGIPTMSSMVLDTGNRKRIFHVEGCKYLPAADATDKYGNLRLSTMSLKTAKDVFILCVNLHTCDRCGATAAIFSR